ncbi:MAG: hypothetical protein ABIH64_01210 [Nanoarchaeota archaeon]
MYSRMPDTYERGTEIDYARGTRDVDDGRANHAPLKRVKTPLAVILVLMATYGCAVNKAASKPFIGPGPVRLTQKEKADYIRRHGKTAGEEIADEEEKSKRARTLSGLVDNALKIIVP